ncbi:MAG: Ig-like domain-containing protein [Xanthomonadales bacterium]|nr:Ig-like domain-containing protein [Xanthomonadales bacterium]MCB1578258.1 Ig-like domain-containing protein [Xanthomonadales bacterium]
MDNFVARFLASVATCGMLLLGAVPATAQTYTAPLSVEAVGPTEFSVVPGHVLQEPFRLRVLDGNGHPVSGFPVTFHVDGPACFLGMCPPAGTFGYFLVPPPQLFVETIGVDTDANGVATAPTFRTNDELASVFGGIGWDYEVSGYPFVEYRIVEGTDPPLGAGPNAGEVLPVNSPVALIMLCALLGLFAAKRLRWRDGLVDLQRG